MATMNGKVLRFEYEPCGDVRLYALEIRRAVKAWEERVGLTSPRQRTMVFGKKRGQPAQGAGR